MYSVPDDDGAIHRTAYVSCSFCCPSLSQPRPLNPRPQFLGYRHKQELVESHRGMIRGLTNSPRSCLDLPLWMISVRFAEVEMRDGEGRSQRKRTLGARAAATQTHSRCVRACCQACLGRINYPYTRELPLSLGQINRDPVVERMRQTNLTRPPFSVRAPIGGKRRSHRRGQMVSVSADTRFGCQTPPSPTPTTVKLNARPSTTKFGSPITLIRPHLVCGPGGASLHLQIDGITKQHKASWIGSLETLTDGESQRSTGQLKDPGRQLSSTA
jgi:hypothetical protein